MNGPKEDLQRLLDLIKARVSEGRLQGDPHKLNMLLRAISEGEADELFGLLQSTWKKE